MKKAKTILIVVHLLVIAGFGSFIYWKYFHNQKEAAPQAVSLEQVIAGNAAASVLEGSGTGSSVREPAAGTAMTVNVKAPEELNLDLPFYSQAPFANWDMPWQEACEEASVLLVANAYYQHNWTREQFNDEILKLVEWEKEKFGDYKHTSIEQTAQILKEYLGLQSEIAENPDFDDIRSRLVQGNLIVMTFAGKMIGNPNYKNGGPVYHAMVIKGYKADEKVITHDVGTRKGEDYVYKWSTLSNALHDWAVPIETGDKKMIVVLHP